MARPEFDALIITKYEVNGEERSRFQKVGVAFAAKFKAGPGYSLKLDGPIVLVPGQNDLVIAPPLPKEESGL